MFDNPDVLKLVWKIRGSILVEILDAVAHRLLVTQDEAGVGVPTRA